MATKKSVKATPPLVVEQWEIGRLKAHPENYKNHPETEVRRLRESLRARGFLKPIVVHAERGLILAGHGVFQAAVEEGFKTVPVVPWSTTNEEADAYLVDDNLIDRDATNDAGKLDSLLKRLVEDARGDADSTHLFSYDQGDLEALLSKNDAIMAQAGADADEVMRAVAGKGAALEQAGFSPAAAEALALAATATPRAPVSNDQQPGATANNAQLRIPILVYANNPEEADIIRRAFKHPRKETELDLPTVLMAALSILQEKEPA